MKKCPVGFICVENYSMFFIITCLIIFTYIIYSIIYKQSNYKQPDKIVINNNNTDREMAGWFGGLIPSWPYTNLPSDPLLNPYAPPLRDERYFNTMLPSRAYPLMNNVPINVSTNVGAVDTQYRQLGIMTSNKDKGKIIPLMGRPLFTNRDKWQYYTMSDQYNSMKLPISKNGKSCTNEYGCDKMYNGDFVYVEGVNEPYRITMYDNDTIKYLPFL